jgi:hypothetical protein
MAVQPGVAAAFIGPGARAGGPEATHRGTRGASSGSDPESDPGTARGGG